VLRQFLETLMSVECTMHIHTGPQYMYAVG
jgi:hypothetical protein